MGNEGGNRREHWDPDIDALQDMNGASHILEAFEDVEKRVVAKVKEVGQEVLATIIPFFGGDPKDPSGPKRPAGRHSSNRLRKPAA